MITTVGQPDRFTPVFNPVVFYFDSTKKNEQAFRYLVDIYSAGTNVFVARQTIWPRQGDGYCIADLNGILGANVSYLINQNLSGFSTCNDNFYNYDLQIGEEYVFYWPFNDNFHAGTILSATSYPGNVVFSSFTTNHSFSVGDQLNIQQVFSATNIQYNGVHNVVEVPNNRTIVLDVPFGVSTAAQSGTGVYADERKTQYSGLTSITNKYIFNSAFSHKEFYSYSQNSWLVGSSTIGQFLTNAPNNQDAKDNAQNGLRVRPENNNWFNFISLSSQTEAVYCYITTSDGDTFRFPQGSLTGSNKSMLVVGVGPNNFPSSTTAVSGSFPIIKDTTTYYTVYLANAAGSRTSQKFRFNLIDNCSKYDKYELLFMDRKGSFLTFNFTLNSVQTIKAESTEYQKMLGNLVGSKYGYNSTDAGRTKISIVETEQYTLNTDRLNLAEFTYLKELVTSPVVFMRVSGESEYWPVIVTTDTKDLDKQLKNKKFQIQVESANRNNIQSF